MTFENSVKDDDKVSIEQWHKYMQAFTELGDNTFRIHLNLLRKMQ